MLPPQRTAPQRTAALWTHSLPDPRSKVSTKRSRKLTHRKREAAEFTWKELSASKSHKSKIIFRELMTFFKGSGACYCSSPQTRWLRRWLESDNLQRCEQQTFNVKEFKYLRKQNCEVVTELERRHTQCSNVNVSAPVTFQTGATTGLHDERSERYPCCRMSTLTSLTRLERSIHLSSRRLNDTQTNGRLTPVESSVCTCRDTSSHQQRHSPYTRREMIHAAHIHWDRAARTKQRHILASCTQHKGFMVHKAHTWDVSFTGSRGLLQVSEPSSVSVFSVSASSERQHHITGPFSFFCVFIGIDPSVFCVYVDEPAEH
ncbi:uncharacterized protein V6R79_018679 [Siganus canaliculatus]